jgi:glycosyltransferase involved in cell wall biosynthesis
MTPELDNSVRSTKREDDSGGMSAILLSWKRPTNMPRIVNEILSVPFVKEIIIWNNNPEIQLEFSNCKVINSSHNFMPFARYSAAMLASEKTILFQDDDMLFPKRSVERAYNEYLKDRSRIYGTKGRNLDNGKYNRNSVIGECDIVLGQFMVFSKELLASVLQNILMLMPFDRGDDIAFCLLCETKHIALGLEHEDLGGRDEFSLFRQKDHAEKRQMMVERVVQLKKFIAVEKSDASR